MASTIKTTKPKAILHTLSDGRGRQWHVTSQGAMFGRSGSTASTVSKKMMALGQYP